MFSHQRCYICLTPWIEIEENGLTAHARHCNHHPQPVEWSGEQIKAYSKSIADKVYHGPAREDGSLAERRRKRFASEMEEDNPTEVDSLENGKGKGKAV
jgi:hypothetical protein